MKSVSPDSMCSSEFIIKKRFSEEAHNRGFLQLPGLLFYLAIGKGSEIEVKTDSAGEKKPNKCPSYQEKAVELIKRNVQILLNLFQKPSLLM